MNNTLKANARKRIIKSAVIGLVIGAILLGSYLVPIIITGEREKKASLIHEDNLIASGGKAFDAFSMAEVSITVLLDGKPQEGMSVSASYEKWITPQNGVVSLRVAPNRYDFIAGYENRRVFFSSEAAAEQSNNIVLDVGNAPSVPELQMFDLSMNKTGLLPLGISNADEVTAEVLPNGVSITRQNGEFILQIDSSQIPFGFSTLSLTAKNHSGEASFFIGLRNPRKKEIVEIYNVDDLANIRNDLSGSYRLMNNLDMSDVNNWAPIGTINNPFTGVFDGGNYELTGFHSPEQISLGENFALFGCIKNAELRNIIFREPIITPKVPDREVGTTFTCSVLVTNSTQSLIENSASFGGVVQPSDNSAGGLLGGSNWCILRNLYSSTDVVCAMKNQFLPNTGGIVSGTSNCYISRCHNAGSVSGNHLTGGVVGYANASTVKNCLNSGYIWGSTIVGAIPAGGILQTNDNGSVGYSYFVRGLSAVGGSCPNGVVTAIIPIEMNDLLIAENLAYLGTFADESPQWGYASLDATGPIPAEIFREKVSLPVVIKTGGVLTAAPADGTQYFYTLDSSSPYTNRQPVPRLDITLKRGQILKVFAAKQGYLDSEILTITEEGGN